MKQCARSECARWTRAVANSPATARRMAQIALVLSLTVYGLSLPALAEERSGDEKALKAVREVVRKVQARYEQTRDLQADFTQKTSIEGFERPVLSSGKVYIKKPGRLRWDYLDPNVEEIYVNKDEVKMYVPEHQQVLIGKLTQMAASQAPLQLLQGVAKLDEEFDAIPTLGKEPGPGGIPVVTLLPKQKDSEGVRGIQRIVLELQPKTFFIKSLSLHEVSGNIATFEFANLKSNSGLKDEVFDFTAPAGVEVVKAPMLSPP